MRIESRKYLYDIVRAAKLALGFMAGKTFPDYSVDPMLRSAVERRLEIVGEALAQLAKTDPATASQTGEYQRVIAFRNILIHGYVEIDHRIVWNVLDQTACRPTAGQRVARHRRVILRHLCWFARLRLQQSQESLRCIGKMLVSATDIEAPKLGVHAR